MGELRAGRAKRRVAALILPDVPPDQPIDLKAHYYREAPAFFGVSLATILRSIVREIALDGSPPHGANLAFHGIFFVMALTAAVTVARGCKSCSPD